MDFQSVVNSMASMACVISVEKGPDGGHGDIRIVTGNPAYIDSIEHPPGGMEMLTRKFVPNSLYTDYLTKDLNFEDFCCRSAMEKKSLHAYAHPDRFDVWFNMTFLPLTPDEGNLCYCVYVMEINRTADTERISRVSGDMASLVLEAGVKIRGAADFKASMNDVIKDIRKICMASTCCILLVDESAQTCSVLCEDTDPDSKVLSISEEPGTFSYPMVNSWSRTISGSNCLIVKDENDMEVVRERNPEWHRSLIRSGVTSLILFPLKSGNELLGYIWATNFRKENAPQIKEALELTTFILGSEIGNYLLLKKLKVLSARDMLTGVLNRNEMNNYIDRLSDSEDFAGKSVGVVFADLNGLKTVNDTEGHDAGDQLLRDAVRALREVFGDEEIFRAGGDEFVMIVIGASAQDIDAQAQALRDREQHYEKVCFAIGSCAAASVRDVRSALSKADEKMYEDKRKYYEAHGLKSNRR